MLPGSDIKSETNVWDRQKEWVRDRKIESVRDREIEIQKDRKTERQRYRKTESEREILKDSVRDRKSEFGKTDRIVNVSECVNNRRVDSHGLRVDMNKPWRWGA